MIVIKYLVINHRGNVTIREREPRLAGNEIALRIQLDVPDKLFERPVLMASMKVPSEAVPKAQITTAVTDNVERIIKETTGLEMHVTVVEHEEES
jgi:hypothetical protein